jgi:hypothetical protein
MPLWLWTIVIGGLAYGLFEVGLRERRLARARSRRLRRQAGRLGFTVRSREQHREVSRLLLVVPVLRRPGDIGPLFDGQLTEGTPLTVFDFVDGVGTDDAVPSVGFLLDFPTEWPTVSLDSAGLHALASSGLEHDFSRALLASDLCQHLAGRPDWTFTFSGGHVLGATAQRGDDDLVRLVATAEGVAARIPAALITRWAALPAEPALQRQAS